MAKRKPPKPKRSPRKRRVLALAGVELNETTAGLVAAITGTAAPNGEDLIADPKLKQKFREAKKQEKSRR